MRTHSADQTRRTRPGIASFVRLLAAVCAMLLADAPVRATTLAILRTPDQVIIAADSRRIWHGTEQRPQPTK